MNPTIIFMFAGRQANLELQLPYLRRILAEHPDTELHIWDLSRTFEDHVFIEHITGERITVFRHLYNHGRKPWQHFNDVWRHYGLDRAYKGHTFVKIDDDVVFIETEAFDTLRTAVADNPGTVVSAKVINNGACTAAEPDLWFGFESLGIDLLDVHTSAEYADLCHRWFFDHWRTTVGRRPALSTTTDWLSINLIGFDWRTCYDIARRLDSPSPETIAGRAFKQGSPIGDEGAVNMLPRLIHDGFVAAHLTFGPQDTALGTEQIAEYRKMYADIANEYLG
ncbi:MAG: hypothetical protein PGN30_10260 [Mycolicibacterium neoaurum]|uniref:hypothetical protein n=1 Tax=Mycolicibacterium neoaurum TaxID=1795 RepID=UPI002FFCC259